MQPKKLTELLKKTVGPRQQLVGTNGLRYRRIGENLQLIVDRGVKP
jgi:hypothetical protein